MAKQTLFDIHSPALTKAFKNAGDKTRQTVIRDMAKSTGLDPTNLRNWARRLGHWPQEKSDRMDVSTRRRETVTQMFAEAVHAGQTDAKVVMQAAAEATGVTFYSLAAIAKKLNLIKTVGQTYVFVTPEHRECRPAVRPQFSAPPKPIVPKMSEEQRAVAELYGLVTSPLPAPVQSPRTQPGYIKGENGQWLRVLTPADLRRKIRQRLMS